MERRVTRNNLSDLEYQIVTTVYTDLNSVRITLLSGKIFEIWSEPASPTLYFEEIINEEHNAD